MILGTQKILVIDNYDSFTYNLVYMLRQLLPDAQIDVFRNDEISLKQVDDYQKIVLSPGPSLPDEAGLLKPIIRAYGAKKSILGVCLGHQAIAEVYGAQLYNMERVKHGVKDFLHIKNNKESVFEKVPNNSEIGLYHSWSIQPASVPVELKITATNSHGDIMAIKHTTHDITGFQFHPESILTQFGDRLLNNWLHN